MAVSPLPAPSSTPGHAALLSLVLPAAALIALLTAWKASSPRITNKTNDKKLFQPASTLPILGNMLDLLWFQKHRIHDWITEQSEAAGGRPWVLTMGGDDPRVVLTSPDAYEDVFKTQFDVFIRGEGTIGFEILGKGILNVDGELWRKQRRVTSHLFSMSMLKDSMNVVVREKTVKMCHILADYAAKGSSVSMKELLNKFTADVFTKIGFGVDLNGLDEDVNVHTEHPVDVAAEVIQVRLQSATWLWKLRRFLNIGSERKLKESVQQVHDLINGVMAQSVAAKQHSDEEGLPHPVRTDLVTLLMQSSDPMSPQEIRDAAINFFGAGKDTTAFSMSWFIVEMNRHPRVLQKIRDELKAKLPQLSSREVETPNIKDLSQLTYLHAALKESLRLHSLSLYRYTSRDTTLSDGTFLPRGSDLMFSGYASARMTSIWGPDAAEYKPERWIDSETGELRIVSPYQFIPFSAGPRVCIGMRLAMMEMLTVLATLFSRFDLETEEDPHAITYNFSFVLSVKGPFNVRVRDLAAASS